MSEYAPFTPEEITAIEELKRKAAVRLRERREYFRVPEIEFMPSAGDVILFRLPAPERKTDGGIFLPDHEINNIASMDEQSMRAGVDKYVANQNVVNNGLVLCAGPEADDWLLSEGIFYGDIVKFGKYAGQEQRGDMYTLSNAVSLEDMKDILNTHYRDIRGSFDLWHRVMTEPVLEKRLVVDQSGNWSHVYKPIVRN